MTVLARRLLCWLVFMAALKGCGSTPNPWYRQELEEIQATVTAIDTSQRLLSMRDDEGHTATIVVGPEVRNFEQIEVGDQVVATYHQAMAAAVTRPDQAVKQPQIDITSKRAEPGQAPHAEASASLIATVVIEAVDKESSTLTFRRDDGMVRTVRVEDPSAQQFVKELKRGDQVTVTYTEAVAVSVREKAVL